MSSRFRQRGEHGGRGRQSFIFAQQGRGGRGGGNTTFSRMNTDDSNEIVVGTDGETFPNILCFGCNFHGHYCSTYPYITRRDDASMHVGLMLAQDDSFSILKSWLLLDTCSTCDVFNNPDLVTRIRACTPNEVLLAYTNGESQKFEQIADLCILPITVYFKANYMAIILNLNPS